MRMLFALWVLGCGASHGAEVDAGSGGDAGLPVDAAAIVDSGPALVDGGPAPIDAGMPALDASVSPGHIACGSSECAVGAQGCLASCLYATDVLMPACIALDESGAWPADDCPTGRERFPRYWLRCDGSEDCAPGEQCHILFGSLGQYAQCAACNDGCDLRFFNLLCRTDGECPAAVPHCRPTDALPGYSTCVE